MLSSRIDKSQTHVEIIQSEEQQKTFIALLIRKFETYCDFISASLFCESTSVYLPNVITLKRSDKVHNQAVKKAATRCSR